MDAKVPKDMEKAIKSRYDEMVKREGKDIYVAVRSSATAEDLPDASFAGQQETFLNVKGAEKVFEAVRKCWASLYGARAIFYRAEQGFEHEKVNLSAIGPEDGGFREVWRHVQLSAEHRRAASGN